MGAVAGVEMAFDDISEEDVERMTIDEYTVRSPPSVSKLSKLNSS